MHKLVNNVEWLSEAEADREREREGRGEEKEGVGETANCSVPHFGHFPKQSRNHVSNNH